MNIFSTDCVSLSAFFFPLNQSRISIVLCVWHFFFTFSFSKWFLSSSLAYCLLGFLNIFISRICVIASQPMKWTNMKTINNVSSFSHKQDKKSLDSCMSINDEHIKILYCLKCKFRCLTTTCGRKWEFFVSSVLFYVLTLFSFSIARNFKGIIFKFGSIEAKTDKIRNNKWNGKKTELSASDKNHVQVGTIQPKDLN